MDGPSARLPESPPRLRPSHPLRDRFDGARHGRDRERDIRLDRIAAAPRGAPCAGQRALSMRVPATPARVGARGIDWRAVEWWGAGLSLFLFSGALFPLLLAPDGLTDAARGKLRLLSLPVYGFTAVMVVRHFEALRIALLRTVPLAALTLLPLISVVWSVSGSTSLRRAVAFLLSTALAYVIAIRFTPRQLAVLVVWVVGPCLAASLALAVVAPGLASMPAHEGASGLRGVYIHKNVLGWYAALMLVAAREFLHADAAPRPLGVALVGAAALCLAASGSATSLITVAAAAGVWGFYWLFARLAAPGRVLLLIGALAAGGIVMVDVGNLIGPALEALGKDPTLTGRTTLWREVDVAIGARPVFGYGYQAFWADANPDAWAIRARVAWAAPHAHNGYRDLLLNFGLVGFAASAWIIFKSVRQGVALYVDRPMGDWLWLNVLIGVYLLMNSTESLLFLQNETLSVLFTAALVMCALRAPELQARRRVADRW